MTIYREVKNTQGLKSKYMRIALGGTNPSFVLTGFTASKSGSMDVDITAGTAYIKDSGNETYEVTSSATETLTLTGNDVTNYIFLHCNNGANWLTFSTTATVPDDAILIATVVTVAGDITSVVDSRTIINESRNKLLVDFKGYSFGTYWDNLANPPIRLYLNELQTDKIKLKSIKYNYYMELTEALTVSLTSYYNVGAGDVEIDSVSLAWAPPYSKSGTVTKTINASTSATSTIPYIKFVPADSATGLWILKITQIYLEYELID